MTRVAIFTDNDFDKLNGVTTTLKAVLEYTDLAEARIYTAADLDVDTPRYFAAASFGLRLPWYREMRVHWPRLRAFATALRASGVDVVHITTPGPVGLAGRWLARELCLPLVGSYHTHLGDYVAAYSGSATLGGVLERYMRWCYAPCDPLLVPSEAARELLLRRGYRPDRIRVWGRGVDATRFLPTRASQALRDSWHVDHRRPAILYAGRLSREKGLNLVGTLARHLDRHHIAHQLVFAGDGPMRAALEAMCPGAIFLGRLPHDRVAVAMASADLFLFPSATDTLGNVVLEAQASGLPVIVSDEGGPRQQIVPDVTGLVCRADDAGAFTRAVTALLRAPRRRAEMGRDARRHAETRDWRRALEPLLGAWQFAADRGVPKDDAVVVGAHPTAAISGGSTH